MIEEKRTINYTNGAIALKAWGDYKKDEMPPGVIMTILAGTNYYEDSRDDISLYENLRNLMNG